jgi:hypothetical protein
MKPLANSLSILLTPFQTQATFFLGQPLSETAQMTQTRLRFAIDVQALALYRQVLALSLRQAVETTLAMLSLLASPSSANPTNIQIFQFFEN